MPEDVSILTARRAYEFSAEHLRLTMLTTEPLLGRVKQLFRFQNMGVGMPIPTFGPVPPTLPPGVVFNLGFWSPTDGLLCPIRFLHFEPTRIVIDVAGPSHQIDGIYTALIEAMKDIRAPDGSMVIGEPRRTMDYSEITARLKSPVDHVFDPAVREAIASAIAGEEPGALVVPTVYFQVQRQGGTIQSSVTVPDSLTLHIGRRVGSLPQENIWFTAAPLPSDRHLDFLGQLETRLAG